MKMWIEHEDCINIVTQSWNNNAIGCPMYILNQKLNSEKQRQDLEQRNFWKYSFLIETCHP